MDVFDLAAKISLDTSGFEKGLSGAKDKMSAFGDVFKANIASDVVSKGFSAMTAGIGKAVDGFKSLVTESTKAYGDYQQMIGGVQKLYGNMGKSPKEYAKLMGKSTGEIKGQWNKLEKAQNTVIKNAENAYKTSGMSMNSYMETATQFSASLIKSLKGDTQKAADQTDVAMRAISDNFNTFGGNIEDITNAYKGFSKQNYTMLDNLKLGYGGTKTEMENLIKDANTYAKSIGKAGNLSINSFSDIVTAIDLIQQKQQIAGTTAREASTTLEGSFGQMQAAWENLKTNISNKDADIGKNVSQLVDTIVGRSATAEDVAVGAAKHIGDHVGGYLDNLMPVVEKALDGIGQLVSGLAPIISEELPKLMKKIVPPVVEAIGTLATTIIQALPELIQSIEDAFSAAFGNIDFGALASKVSDLIAGLSDAIAGLLPDLITIGAELITAIIQGISDNSQEILNGAKEIIVALGNGIIQNAPQLMSSATTIITSLLDYITQNADAIISGGLKIIETLGQGIVDNLPKLADSVVQLLQGFSSSIDEHKDELSATAVAIVTALVNALIEVAPSLAEAGGTLVGAIGQALIDNIPVLVEKLPEFVSSVNNGLSDAFDNASPEGKLAIAGVVGKMVVGGIGDGLGKVKDAKDTVDKVKGVFGKIFGEDGLVDKIKGIDFKGTADAFGMLADSLKMSAGLKLDSLKTLFSTIGSTVSNGIANGLSAIGTFITGTLVPGIGTLITTLAPFLPLILGISAAVVGIILVIKNWDKVSAALKVTWEALKDTAGKVFNGIKDVVSKAWDGIKSVSSTVWDGIKGAVSKVWDGMKSSAGKVFGGIKDTVGKAWDKIKSNTSKAWSNIKSTVEKNGGGIKGVIKTAAQGYLAPWKAGFEALNKASNGKLGEAVKGVQKNLAIMKAKFKAHNAAMKYIAKGLVDKVQQGWSGIKEAGGNFVKGLWNGINDKVGWVVDKVKGFGGKVLNALKKFFKIESPSKVMRDEIGVYLAQGVAKGIEKDEAKAVKAAEKMASKIVKSSKKIVLKATKGSDSLAEAVYKSIDKTEKKSVKTTETKKLKSGKTKTTTKNKSVTVARSKDDINDDLISEGKKKVKSLEDANKMSLQQEASFWVSIARKAGKGTVQYGQAMKLANKTIESQQANTLEKAKNSLQSYQDLHDTSAKYEASYWKKYLNRFTKGSKQDLEVRKLYNDARKKIQDERLEKYQDYVNNYSALHNGEEMTAKATMDYWEYAKKKFTKGSSQWIEVQNSFLAAQKSFNDSYASLMTDFTNSTQEAQKTYDDALKQIDDNINSRRDSILSGLGDIFAQFDAGDPADKDAMSKALDSQLAAEDEWSEKLEKLGEKVGTDSELYKMMSGKGATDGLAYLRAFVDSMSDEELASYNERYNERIKKAREEAEKELKPETDEAQKKALEDYVSSMSDAYQTAIRGMKDLGLTSKQISSNITSGTTTLVKDIANKMTSLGTKTSETQDKIKSIIQDKAPDIAYAAKTSGADMLSSFISGIDSKKGELISTLEGVSKTVASYIGFSEPDVGPLSDFHTFAPDMMKLFASGITDNAHLITDAFNQTLGFAMPDNYGTITVKPDKDSLMGENGVGQILGVLQQYLPQLGNQQIVLDDGTLVGKTAPAMNEQLAYLNNRKAGAFA